VAGQPGKHIMKTFISTLISALLATFVVPPVQAQIVEKKSLNLDGAKKAITAAADYAKKNNRTGRSNRHRR